jgi:hypothetical protein
MLRRRLLSIVGAVGLVATLVSSGVAAQASKEAPTLDAQAQAWSTSDQSVCLSNGESVPLASDGTCMIVQVSSDQHNIAICVQNDTTVESCSIDQTNVSGDNRAIVVQHYNQSKSPSENATQTVDILQTNGVGRNDARVLQMVRQKTSTADTSNTQTQIARQFDSIDQTAVTGGQKVSLDQKSSQAADSDSAATQNQFSDQDVSDFGHHVNQNSAGLSEIAVKQDQSQKATGTGSQDQEVDPRCCSVQQSNADDTFSITETVSQMGNPSAFQDAISAGVCATSGNCMVSQSSQNNNASTTNTCSSSSCTAVISCSSSSEGGSCVPTSCTSGDCSSPPPHLCPSFVPSCNEGSPVITAAILGDRALAMRGTLARSAPSDALLT